MLRKAITEGSLQPGHPLRQVELARQLGTSRIPLREALKALEGEGLVEIHPCRGAVLRTLSVEEVTESTEVLVALSAVLLRRAIAGTDEEALEALDALVDRLGPEPGGLAVLEATSLAYGILFRCARSPLLEKLLRSLNGRLFPHTPAFLEVPQWRADVAAYVRRLVALLRRRDTEACIELMVQNRLATSAEVKKHMRAARLPT